MSNAEHLIENAIHELEAGHDLDDFKALWHTKTMCEQTGIKPEDIWLMAVHVVFVLKQDWIEEGRQEMIDRYGYEPPEE